MSDARRHCRAASEPSGRRGSLGVMSAQRVACRTPWGESHDLLVVHGHVIVPRTLGHVPPLWWLEDENHPRLDVALVGALEAQTGAVLGVAPYCVPSDRWNRGASAQSWLPHLPARETGGSFAPSPGSAPRSDCRQTDGFALPHRRYRVRPGRRHRDHLLAPRIAVSVLLEWPRRMLAAALLAALALALVYYLVATGLWLWDLRSGASGRSLQNGVVLIAAAVVVSSIARRLAARPE